MATIIPALIIEGTWIAQRMSNIVPLNAPESKGPWTPPQWQHPQLTSITVTRPVTSRSTTITSGDSVIPGTSSGTTDFQSTTYFFDAVLRVVHSQPATATRHPVQSGAAISDHVYMEPARIALDILASDAMGRIAANSYTSDRSKSVSMYREWKDIQKLRIPISLTTRLDTYDNMIIEDISSTDEARTRYGLRATMILRQIIIGNTATRTVSARPNQTDTTPLGAKQPAPLTTGAGNPTSPGAQSILEKVQQNRQDPTQIIPGRIAF